MAKVKLEDQYVNFVRNSIDLSVGNTGYPVLASILTEVGIATRQQLRSLESKGLIKGIDIKVPSKLVQGSFTYFRAYYTERNIPQNLDELEGVSVPSKE